MIRAAPLLAAMLVLTPVVLPGCRAALPASHPVTTVDQATTTPAPPTPGSGASAPLPAAEPAIRVRLRSGIETLDITAAGPITLDTPAATGASGHARSMTPPLRMTRDASGFVCRSLATGEGWRWPATTLRLRAGSGQPLTVGTQTFAGTLVFTAAAGGRFDVINHLGLESYLPGVIEAELYGSWHEQAFMAQAIAARSYAITRMGEQTGKHYDVEATQADQAFGGVGRQPKALRAVAATRGMVVTWAGRVLPAYYSSTKGPRGQDAEAAFPTRTPYPPLRGQADQGWGRQSPHYQWGPVMRPVATLSARIADWGRTQRHSVASLEMLRHITVTTRSRTGRPAVFTLVDDRGHRFALPAEAFRAACNHPAAGLAALSRDTTLKSSDVEVSVGRTQVTFANGQGFGHGVGMCQWGAQAMAAAGHPYSAILAFYYPGATLRRAY